MRTQYHLSVQKIAQQIGLSPSKMRGQNFLLEEDVARRIKEKSIKIQFTENIKEFIANKGYDPTFGARPIKRAIQTHVLDQLAMKIVTGKIKADDSILIDYDKKNVIIKKNESRSVVKVL